MYIFVGILFFNFSLFQIDFKMIRSYRTKRRKIQEELKTLHFSKKSNETSNNFNVHTASTSEELNISANIIQKNPKAANNDEVLISTFRQNLEQDYEIPDHHSNYTNCTNGYTDVNKIVDSSETLKSQLANWVVQCNVPNTTVNRLLPILKQHECLHSLPLDCRTLLHSNNTKITNIRLVNPGYYFHFGLREGIVKCADRYNLNDEIKIIVGIDGLPLAKSSSSQFWPILAYVQPFKEYAFLIGLYHGFEKPIESNDFLKEFIDEAEHLVKNGININNSIHKVSIFAICADAPAKSFIMKVKGHSGYHSCTRCFVEGEYLNRRMCFPYQKIKPRERSHEGYTIKVQEEHHVGNSLSDLIRIPGFDMVNSFPLDYMHLVTLGAMRKLINLWIHGPLTVRLPSLQIKKISNNLLSFKSSITNDFVRKPRKIEEVSRWKATELRQFLIYTGPLALKNILTERMYDNFMFLNISMTILLSSNISNNLLNYANSLLNFFVSDFENIYGKHMVSHNIHGLTHIGLDYQRYGQLDSCSCFVFENYMKTLKQMLRKHEKPLEQVIKRYQEKTTNEIVNHISNQPIAAKLSYEHSNGPLIQNTCEPQYLKLILHNKITISTRSSSDSYVLTNTGEVIQVKNIAHYNSTKEVLIIGFEFLNKCPFYDKPIRSSKLNIFIVQNLSKNLKYWKITEIKNKIILFSVKERYIAFPILHSL